MSLRVLLVATCLLGAFAHAQDTGSSDSIVTMTLPPPNTQTSSLNVEPSSLPLGEICDTSEQCADGAQCWASNTMTVARCGNLNAACQQDSQCAFNSCNGGVCNGDPGSDGNSTSSSSGISTPLGIRSASLTSSSSAVTDHSSTTVSSTTVSSTTVTTLIGPTSTMETTPSNEVELFTAVSSTTRGSLVTTTLDITSSSPASIATTSVSTVSTSITTESTSISGVDTPVDIDSTPVEVASTSVDSTTDETPTLLGLGTICTFNGQCASGAKCWAADGTLTKRCGNFGAACTVDSQCAYNVCTNQICKGYYDSGLGAPNGTVPTGSSLDESGNATITSTRPSDTTTRSTSTSTDDSLAGPRNGATTTPYILVSENMAMGKRTSQAICALVMVAAFAMML